MRVEGLALARLNLLVLQGTQRRLGLNHQLSWVMEGPKSLIITKSCRLAAALTANHDIARLLCCSDVVHSLARFTTSSGHAACLPSHDNTTPVFHR